MALSVNSPSSSPTETEEAGATPIALEAEGLGQVKEASRPFLQAARRMLTEKEAQSPAGVRWLTHDVERLDQENADLRRGVSELRHEHEALSSRHFDTRVELEGLRAKSLVSGKNELLSYLSLSGGSALIGAAPGFFSVGGAGALALVTFIIGAVLVLGGIFLRIWK